MNICLFDTSVSTENLGDFIIMDAVREQCLELFSGDMILNVPTHEKISKPSFDIARKSDIKLVGGTNLLSSNMLHYNQWKINIFDSFRMSGICLFGVGWWQYQNKPDFYTRCILKNVLSDQVLHSVRDDYTKDMLAKIGITNILNTGCPTMWRLTEEHCSAIPEAKAENVVFTITDYNRDAEADTKLVRLLNDSYDTVYFWPQGSSDLEYLQSLELKDVNIQLLSPNLESYNQILNVESIDFVGTRLHAGIRALQHKKRTIIIGIDNRAAEKARNFNLPVVMRSNIDDLGSQIHGNFKTKISIPHESIIKWKSQFK